MTILIRDDCVPFPRGQALPVQAPLRGLSRIRPSRGEDEGPHPQVPGPGRRPEDDRPPPRIETEVSAEPRHLARGRRERRSPGGQSARGRRPRLRARVRPSLEGPELRRPHLPRQGTGDNGPGDEGPGRAEVRVRDERPRQRDGPQRRRGLCPSAGDRRRPQVPDEQQRPIRSSPPKRRSSFMRATNTSSSSGTGPHGRPGSI